VIARYRTEKESRGLLDYDDLIGKTLLLLTTVNPSWVHYKLDRGIDHVLIDEAQDTSEPQWEIISRLVSEFTYGAGAREVSRTISRSATRSSRSSRSGRGAEKWTRCGGISSATRRSVTGATALRAFVPPGPMCSAPPTVFAARAVYASVTTDEAGIAPHLPLPDAAPGVVIWPLMRPEVRRGSKAGTRRSARCHDEPAGAAGAAHRRHHRARHREPRATGRDRKPMAAGDVLVLVRQRGALFEAVIRALKDRRIPVAGADRLVLTEHVAVVDLMALADALLLPDDDLALAIVLKSPLFGLDEDQLFAIAYGRTGSLWAALAAKAKQEPAFAAAAGLLERCAAAARAATPFGFYAWLLGAAGGRASFLRRLGPEANDALDEFLETALDYERREAPSLQGFMAWLRAAQTEIKRDMAITRDEVGW
jgi:ATP-dependent helicase/nuclease subunit A